ncbi:MAG: 4-hydroxybenzoate octaprenyltransferase [Pseudomonadota bacterium]|nr:4-hydroxybenzoate octaprenyltransferase [Pseudomonadota bacterium]
MQKISQAAPPHGPADAAANNWVDKFAPAAAKPYLRLMRADRPIGTWLLLLPCWWGLGLAAAQGSGSALSLWHAALFAVGAFVMRGAGCAYNDIVDRDIDAKVARTAMRPLPSGQIGLGRAWAFLVALCLVGLLVLLQFNPFTIYLGLGSLGLVAIYPFMKRVTYWPQAWLGLTFNWGALMGYAAATGSLSWSVAALYAAGIFWTLGYDTIYAHQDKEDDALIGVKSSALKLGAKTRPAIALFYGATLALFALAGLIGGLSIAYYLALSLACAHFFLQWRRLDIGDGSRCLTIFKSNREAGLLLLAPLLLETALNAA